jgi:hypothetical protein
MKMRVFKRCESNSATASCRAKRSDLESIDGQTANHNRALIYSFPFAQGGTTRLI